jgi:hypothetical protein
MIVASTIVSLVSSNRSEDQRSTRQTWTSFQKGPVTIAAEAADKEAQDFAEDLREALERAGYKADGAILSGVLLNSGIWLEVLRPEAVPLYGQGVLGVLQCGSK